MRICFTPSEQEHLRTQVNGDASRWWLLLSTNSHTSPKQMIQYSSMAAQDRVKADDAQASLQFSSEIRLLSMILMPLSRFKSLFLRISITVQAPALASQRSIASIGLVGWMPHSSMLYHPLQTSTIQWSQHSPFQVEDAKAWLSKEIEALSRVQISSTRSCLFESRTALRTSWRGCAYTKQRSRS